MFSHAISAWEDEVVEKELLCIVANTWATIYLRKHGLKTIKPKRLKKILTQHQYFGQVDNLDKINEQLVCINTPQYAVSVNSDTVGLSFVALFVVSNQTC